MAKIIRNGIKIDFEGKELKIDITVEGDETATDRFYAKFQNFLVENSNKDEKPFEIDEDYEYED